MIQTPEFKGTHLWNRIMWAKQNLEPYKTEYRIVWEDPSEPEECAKVINPAYVSTILGVGVALLIYIASITVFKKKVNMKGLVGILLSLIGLYLVTN